MTDIKDNPPPLPEPAIEDHDYELWGQNMRGDFFSAEQCRQIEAAAFARGVAARQPEIDELKRINMRVTEAYEGEVEDSRSLHNEIDELRAKLRALEEQKPVAWVTKADMRDFGKGPGESAFCFTKHKDWNIPLCLAAGAKP